MFVFNVQTDTTSTKMESAVKSNQNARYLTFKRVYAKSAIQDSKSLMENVLPLIWMMIEVGDVEYGKKEFVLSVP